MKQRFLMQGTALLMLLMSVSLPLAAKVSGLPNFTELFEKTGPAVVNIRVTLFGTRSGRSSDQNDGQPDGRGENPPEVPEFF